MLLTAGIQLFSALPWIPRVAAQYYYFHLQRLATRKVTTELIIRVKTICKRKDQKPSMTMCNFNPIFTLNADALLIHWNLTFWAGDDTNFLNIIKSQQKCHIFSHSGRLTTSGWSSSDWHCTFRWPKCEVALLIVIFITIQIFSDLKPTVKNADFLTPNYA